MDDGPASKRRISDGLRRLLDQRGEERGEAGSQTAILNHNGHRHVVRLINLSSSGAMVSFEGDMSEGDAVVLQLLDHGSVTGQVRWVRDGQAGVSFSGSVASIQDEE